MTTNSGDKVVNTLNDVMERLQSIAEFQNRIILVHNEDELFKRAAGANLPVVGVAYEGMGNSIEDTKPTHNTGLSGVDLSFAIAVLYRITAMDPETALRTSLALMDKVRTVLKDQKAPPGHFYRFRQEVGGELDKGNVIWLQRWSTKVQLV